ncbi:ABC transporter substrate-binding protein [Amantichitinum ursilacus]|uniref:Probable sugar-binding periplasmic protein n=1 Tax=Amantichitinum ursilacus TaxID=857265 RepID=A0A0N0XL00_9NEIS|nr:ABC transporter substrate-binding protein [Amantichitinum ursilacus]KPC54667.1 putative sugar-binding periplasmic protein precursor [Amantichitinum ursilacus]
MLLGSAAGAADLQVLHWWSSGGEAKAASALKAALQEKGDHWKDFLIPGGADAAITTLNTMATAGALPDVAQSKGPAIQYWAQRGLTADVDSVALRDHWDQTLPQVVQNVMKYQGHYVAAPVNVHRVNWLWVNQDLLNKVNAKTPTTWDEFFATAAALKKAGITAVAYGQQPWQDATVFETVVLGVGGAEFYRKALVERDPAALKSPTMLKSLETWRRIKQYTDNNAAGRDWNLATSMVITGKAAMQFMGDWAKGEFLAAGKVPGKDFMCVPAPGTADSYTFNIDSFVFFKSHPEAAKAQGDLAEILLSARFQQQFNLDKGSIPVKLGSDMSRFDACGKQSARDFEADDKKGTLVPSFAHDMAVKASTKNAMVQVLTKFWTTDSMTPAQAAAQLVAAAK